MLRHHVVGTKSELKLSPVTLVITGEIENDLMSTVSDQLQEAADSGQTILPVLINSTGGDLHIAFGILELLRSCGLDVVTIGNGIVGSAALLIYSIGRLRYLSETARVMLHDASMDINKSVSGPELKTEAKEMHELNELMYSVIAENVGGDSEYFYKRVRREGHAVDLYMNAREAVECRLATHIGIPEFIHTISVRSSIRESQDPTYLKFLGTEEAPAKDRKKKKSRKLTSSKIRRGRESFDSLEGW